MKDFARLMQSWFNGTYKVFPWRTLLILVLLAIYAINPFDIIPDFIPIIGVIDDAAMLGFLVRSLMKDIQRFREWEQAQAKEQGSREVVDAEYEVVKEEKNEPKGQLKN